MEFRHLRSFLVVADELNIGRAAKRLFIAQPPLSKQIQQLESELGVQLFERIPKGLKLTPEGETLVIEAKKIKLAIDAAIAAVDKSGHGSSGKLAIGFAGASPNIFLPKLLAKTNKAYPNIDIQIQRKANSNVVLESVTNGELDAGIVLLPISAVGIAQMKVSRHSLIAAIPRAHRFATKDKISMKELQDERFITHYAYKGAVLREVFISACHTAGFNPNIVSECSDTYSILILVAAGLGVTVTLEGLENLNANEVKYIPIYDSDIFLEMAIVWREDNPSLVLKNTLQVFHNSLENQN